MDTVDWIYQFGNDSFRPEADRQDCIINPNFHSKADIQLILRFLQFTLVAN